ncbi:MAG TPA: zinc ABC transporter substrate-binding protein [Acidobacteriota bacterium]|nr:zinc ABC transporter substrate-binding protein [Acidobacteriota bacterium]
MRRLELITGIIISLIILILLSGCTTTNVSNNDTIATTFLPIYEFTRIIAGNTSTVFSIVPTDAEPHEYDSSPKDLIKVDKSSTFVTLGVGFAAFEDKLISSIADNVTIINASASVVQIRKDDDESTGLDPHIWISPRNAAIMATNIRDGLIQKNPHNAAIYSRNAAQLIADLQNLDSAFAKGLSDCDKNMILAAHDAYSYLARDYNFTAYFIDGLSPEQEPTPRQIANLIDIAQQNNIQYILYEENVDPRISNVIASQVSATPLVIDPYESSTNDSATYISVMQENLYNLQQAMGCR